MNMYNKINFKNLGIKFSDITTNQPHPHLPLTHLFFVSSDVRAWIDRCYYYWRSNTCVIYCKF